MTRIPGGVSRSEIKAAFEAIAAVHPEFANALSCLRVSEKHVYEVTSSREFSRRVWDLTFPLANTCRTFFHYTYADSFESILLSGELWLFSLRRRLQEQELTTFCDHHGLNGYLQLDTATGRRHHEALADDLFYLSMTCDADAATMSLAFSKGKPSVRLELRLRPIGERCEVRQIAYLEDKVTTLYSQLQQIVRTKLRRELVLWGVSRAIAFMLPETLKSESETRLLVKRFFTDDEAHRRLWPTKFFGAMEYLAIPIDQQNHICGIDLVGVAVGDARRSQHFNALLAASGRGAMRVCQM